MKKEITSRDDIKFIISEFYKKLNSDKTTIPFFIEIVENNELDKHVEVITDFWQDILFNTTSYHQNVLQKHLDFNKKVAFEKEHFTTWLHYFKETIDCFFEGENAVLMKNRATSIAMVMQVKFSLYN